MTPAIVGAKLHQARAKTQPPTVLVLRWVNSSNEASKAAQSGDADVVWIVRKESLADSLAQYAAASNRGKKAGYLMLHLKVRSALLPPLEKRFKAVAFASCLLPREELEEVLTLPDRKDRFR
jgi:hypothetical protein